MSDSQPPFDAYNQAQLRIKNKDGIDLVLKVGILELGDSDWPFESDHVFVITAHNPGVDIPYSAVRNGLRNQRLKLKLKSLGANFIQCVGEDPSGEWPAEKSFAVSNLPIESMRLLATEFGQAAIFSLNRESLSVVLI